MGYRPMSRILTIANQKGGVGKTTTAVNLAASLAAAEHRTLLVDVDPQGNAGSAFGIRRDESERSIYEVLLDGLPMPEAIRKTELKFLDLVPASRHLVGAELELGGVEGRERRLKQAIDSVASDYEYVVIDCPPSLGLLTLNGLVAAQGVVIPLQCEYYALEGLADVLKTIELERPALLCGVPTLFNAILNHPRLHPARLRSIRYCVSGAAPLPVELLRRFEEATGTNPEELIGAAHAGCYSMALSSYLTQAGFVPERIHTTARVSLEKQGDAFVIPRIDLNTEATVPGLLPDAFEKFAEDAKKNCPVSRALAGVEIHLSAKLLPSTQTAG